MTEPLLTSLNDESDLCRNEGATDIANLLDEAVKEIERLERELEHQRSLADVRHSDAVTARAELAERTKERDKWADELEALRTDPAKVHVNMLRGFIAPITLRQCAHVHGGEAVKQLDAMEASIPYAELLRAALESARDGFINLRPDSGPMHEQMTKHVERIATALASSPSQFTDQRHGADSPTGQAFASGDQVTAHSSNKADLASCYAPEQTPSVQSAPATPIPEGWKLVPMEPTEAMLYALGDLRGIGPWAWKNSEAWAAMLAAAPEPPKPDCEEGEGRKWDGAERRNLHPRRTCNGQCQFERTDKTGTYFCGLPDGHIGGHRGGGTGQWLFPTTKIAKDARA